MSEHFQTSIKDGIATFILDRPKSLNALSPAIVQGMQNFFAEIEHDPAVRCLVIKGSGDHFMAGGDIKRFMESTTLSPDQRRRQFEAGIHQLHPAMFLLRRMQKPVIASVRGAAAGYGLSLVMACDLAIAADDAYFTLAYVNIGTSPDGSGTYSLPRIVGTRKALEIALLGDRFDAKEAHRLNLVNFVVPAADLEAATEKLARRLANGPSVAIGNTKRLIHQSQDTAYEQQLHAEAVSFSQCVATEDMMEGIKSFVEKRKPAFKGR